MKKLLLVLCSVVLVVGVTGIANSTQVTIEFGFTVTYVYNYPLVVGDKGTGWFSYDTEIPGDIRDFPPPHHDYGYFEGIEMYIGTTEYELYSGPVSFILYSDYSGTDEFQAGWQKVIGNEIDTRIDLSFVGSSDYWDTVPLTLPVPDFDLLNDFRYGGIWNYNHAQGDIIDMQVNFDYDYIRPIPDEPSINSILTFFDEAVEAETIVGNGPGKSAEGRLNALRNMLEMAGDLINIGDIEGACGQLKAALKKCDSDSPPPDFVAGSAVSELCDMILELMTEIGCE